MVNVGPQLAVYEKHNCVLTSCSTCSGRSQYTSSHTCSSCNGAGEKWYGTWYGGNFTPEYTRPCGSCGGSGSVSSTSTCSTCRGSGNSGYKKTTYLSNVTVIANTLPADGRHTDGSWYVLKNLIQDDISNKIYKKKED